MKQSKTGMYGRCTQRLTLTAALICVIFLSISVICVSQNVGINTTGNPPNASAGLDVDFTTKGLLIPRVSLTSTTDVATITGTEATSLLVYNTATAGISPNNVTPGYYYWDGAAWVRLFDVNSSDKDWTIDADTLYSYPDSTVVIKGGNVGIGTSSPRNKLDVEGSMAVGSTYSGTTTAPPNGLIVEGNVGVAETTPAATLDIQGLANRPGFLYETTDLGNIALGYTPSFKIVGTDAGGVSSTLFGIEHTNNTATPANTHIIASITNNNGTGITDDILLLDNDDPDAGQSTGNYLSCEDASGNKDFVITMAGNVGIGTTSPDTTLHVAGLVKITGGTPVAGEVLTTDGTGLATWEPAAGAPDADWTIDADTLYSAADSTVTIKNGNVGIGTTTPAYALDISKSNSGNYITRVTNENGTNGNVLQLRSAGSGSGSAVLDLVGNYGGSPTIQIMRAQANGNVGIGTAAPTDFLMINTSSTNQSKGLTIYGNYGSPKITLNVTNQGTFAKIAVFELQDGSTAKGGLLLDRSSNIITGASRNDIALYTASGAGTKLHLATEGNARLTVGSSGNVGIGTTTPDTTLHVAGLVKITGGTPVAGEVLTTDGTGLATWEPAAGAPDADWTIDADTLYSTADSTVTIKNGNVGIGEVAPGAKLTVQTTGTTDILHLKETAGDTVVTVLENGNVGIGTVGPDRKLDVLDASNPQLRLSQADGTVYADFQMTSAGDLVMNVDGVTSQLVLDNSGNVGIGTANPLWDLQIGENGATNMTVMIESSATADEIIMRTGDNSSEWAYGLALRTSGQGSGFIDSRKNLTFLFDRFGSATRLFQINYGSAETPALTIQSAEGNVGIGEVAPGAKLTVQTTGTTDILHLKETAGDTVVTVLENGNVGIGTTVPQGALDVVSTTGAFIVPRMTTTQRGALTAVNGMIIYNTTDNQFNFYENGAWVLK